LRQGSIVPLLASSIVGAAIIAPVVVVLWRSFTTGKLGFTVGLNVANYLRVFGDKDIWSMLQSSVVYAAGAALLGTGLGGLLAWIVARTNTPGKALVELMPLYPILMPPIMKNIAWILLLAPKSGILNGMLDQYLGITYPVFNAFTMAGMIWTFGLACVPWLPLLLPVFLSFDPSPEESAYIAGSRPVHTMLKITAGAAGVSLSIRIKFSARFALLRNSGFARHAGQYQSLCQPGLRFHGFGIQYRFGDGLQRRARHLVDRHALFLCARDALLRALRDHHRQRLPRQVIDIGPWRT
jgi:ABC-type spermidine/putrescine transport system permease subunit II